MFLWLANPKFFTPFKTWELPSTFSSVYNKQHNQERLCWLNVRPLSVMLYYIKQMWFNFSLAYKMNGEDVGNLICPAKKKKSLRSSIYPFFIHSYICTIYRVNVLPCLLWHPDVCWLMVSLGNAALQSQNPANTKHLYRPYHLYNVGPTSSTLVQHCINVIQMCCVCWERQYLLTSEVNCHCI